MNIISPTSSDDEVVNWRHDYQLSETRRPVGWFEIPRDLTRKLNTGAFPEGATKYGRKALENESKRVLHAGEGTRNTTLWSAGCNVGRLVGGGEIDLSFAVCSLREAASISGLGDEEIHQVLVRPSGALETGIREPRNRYGLLSEQYLNKRLKPDSFNPNLFVLGSFDFWFEGLHVEAPGFPCLSLQIELQQLGTIYWANYLYFLNEIHLLLLSGAKGTKRIYDLLNEQFLPQASDFEELFVEADLGLGSVIANTPPYGLGFAGEIHDAKKLVKAVS